MTSDVKQLRMRNARQGINKLPLEVLSCIFLVGEETERGARPRKQWYIGFQDLMTQVCSHWRAVAANTRSLWTYIHITRPGPHPLASLYLARAGSATLLDINLELRGRFYEGGDIDFGDWNVIVNESVALLKFLVAHGADVNRWRSLAICAKQPEVLYRVIGFLNARPAPNLRFLSCRWKEFSFEPYFDETNSLSYPHLFTDSYSFSGSSMPRLRCVEFTSVPWGYVFDRHSPLFTGLTSLSLTAGKYATCSLPKLRDLLRANPHLESLSLRTGDTDDDDDDEFETTTESVQLICLSSLSVSTTTLIYWVLGVIQMIRAPVLQKLTLVSHVPPVDENMGLLWPSIATKLPGNKTSNGSHRPDKIAFPLLNELDVSKLTCTNRQLIDMLLSLPTITKISPHNHQIVLLGEDPWVLPKLTHLKLPQGASSYASLGDILLRREQKGFPIKVVELETLEDVSTDELPGTVELVAYTGAILEEDHDETDDECF